MTDVQNSQLKEKVDMASEDKVCTNGGITSSETNECKRLCASDNDAKEVENRGNLTNGLNGVGDSVSKEKIDEKNKCEADSPSVDDKLNGNTETNAGGDGTKKVENEISNQKEENDSSKEESSDKQVVSADSSESNGINEKCPTNDTVSDNESVADKKPNDTVEVESQNQTGDAKLVEKKPAEESPVESVPTEDAKETDKPAVDVKIENDEPEKCDGLKKEVLPETESKPDSQSKQEKVIEPVTAPSEGIAESVDKPEEAQSVTADSKSNEVNQADQTDESKESKNSSEVPLDTSVEKMEVDEPDNVPADLNATTGDVEKDTALSNPCRVVLVKMEENGDKDETKVESATEVSCETTNKGIKRKHSSSSENEVTLDDSVTSHKPKPDDDEEEKDVAAKKIKLDETAEGNAEGTEPSKEENDHQNSSDKNDEADTARKSGRLSAKSKEIKSDEEQSPSTRRSSRSSIKNNQTSLESEKSPNKKSAQSTPNSTPRKSVTPSPKSRGKKTADSPEEKSASENEKTPQKAGGADASSKRKRSLELDDGEDENNDSPVASKRQRRTIAGKTSAKSAALESDDEEESVEKVTSPSRKGRPSKTPKRTKSAKKATTEDAQSSAEESDPEGKESTPAKGRGSKKSRGSTPNDKIDKMKRLLSAANLRINNYAKFWKDCKTDDEKADKIVEHLRQNGLEGNLTIENCQQLRKKKEMEKEIAALNKSNILDTSGNDNVRVTRSRRSQSKRD